MKKALLLILLLPFFCTSQTKYIDSLFDASYEHPNPNDSIQMNSYVLLYRALRAEKSNDSILSLTHRAIEFAKKKNNPIFLTTAYNLHGAYFKQNKQLQKAIDIFNIGKHYAEQIPNPLRIQCVLYRNLSQSHSVLGNVDSAFYYANKTYDAAKQANELKFQSIALGSLASYYIKIGAYDKAIEHLNSSLKTAIELQDTNRIISANLNLGKVLGDNDKYDELIILYNQLLEKYDSVDLASNMDLINLNMGAAYAEVGDYNKSLEHSYKVLNSTSNLRRGLAHGNIGEIILQQLKSGIPASEIPIAQHLKLENNSKKSEEKILDIVSNHFTKSFEDFDEINAENYKVYSYKNEGEFFDYIKSYKKSTNSYKKAWAIANEKNLMYEKRIIAKKLYEQYKKQKKPIKSLEWHEMYVEISDSLNHSGTQQEVGKQLAQFNFTKVKLKDSLEQAKKDAIQQIQIEQQNKDIELERLKKYYLYGGLTLVIGLLMFLFRRFNVTKKQKKLIELQKAAMEEKQIELSKTHLAIKDSINYSKRIQRAIFPSNEDLNSVFSNHFILFKPKDIVSGDFFWCYEYENKKIMVTADCTGHGVPGAFMTIIGINILKEIIQEGILDPAEVLRQINVKLKSRLGQNNESVKDGMDLGICIIDDKMIEYSGAHFPLYHVTDNKLIEYKGSNVFLGIDEELNNIKTHFIPYKKGDQIYLVTDGFPDQRGGIKGKKFFYKPLRDLLLKNSSLELNKQKENLETEFNGWVTNTNQKQMDDVTIVGIKL